MYSHTHISFGHHRQKNTRFCSKTGIGLVGNGEIGSDTWLRARCQVHEPCSGDNLDFIMIKQYSTIIDTCSGMHYLVFSQACRTRNLASQLRILHYTYFDLAIVWQECMRMFLASSTTVTIGTVWLFPRKYRYPSHVCSSTSVRYCVVSFTMRCLCATSFNTKDRQTVVSWHWKVIQCLCLKD